MRLVTVFGGTGFLGHHIVTRLGAAGATVRIAARHPDRRAVAATHGVGSLESIVADVRDERAVAKAVAGADSVVNAVSAYVERGDATYRSVHEEGAANVARISDQHGVQHLVHISGIGADAASMSKYISSRGRGDLAVQQAFPRAVVLRPSVMFGPDDAFLNALAKIIQIAPVIPLIGGGLTRLQPVHVDDVGEAVLRVLQNPGSNGKIYELGGPESYTLRQIIETVAARLGHRRRFIFIPFGLAHSLGRVFEFLPAAPLTVAQVDLLRNDNAPSQGMPGFGELGIVPHGLADAVAELATNG
jgi:NADH dehydrogenase